MTIQEQIYNRFIKALAALKGVNTIDNKVLEAVSPTLLSIKVSLTKLTIKLNEQEFLVKTAIITALMEAANTWPEFEQLHQKQQEREAESTNNNAPPDPNLTGFDKLLAGMLQVPPPIKKKQKK